MFRMETQKAYERIIKMDISSFQEDYIKSTGYVVSTLDSCLWIILKNNNLKDTILTAVNLGNDTDTIDAITGSIAGIIYNYDDIPKSWINKLKNKRYLDEMITKFYSSLN